MDIVGKKITSLHKERNMTQDELAKSISVVRGYKRNELVHLIPPVIDRIDTACDLRYYRYPVFDQIINRQNNY